MSFAQSAIFKIVDTTSELLVRRKKLQVKWHDNWNSEVEDVLLALPEMKNCPHELFGLLLQNQGPTQRRIATVTEKGEPVAVIGIRRRHSGITWDLITNWVIPGELFPVKKGYIMQSLEALGVAVHVAMWRVDEPQLPPKDELTGEFSSLALSELARNIVIKPTHRIDCSSDYDQYWSKNHRKKIRHIRNKTQDFTFEFNGPGAVEWIIKNWAEKWVEGIDEEDMLAASDMLVAAVYLQEQGRYFSFRLLDGDIPIGGETLIVDGDDLVWQVSYRDPDYAWHGVGARLMDIAFYWAQENGFAHLDLGSTYDYKFRWAPQDGYLWEFHIRPEYLHRLKQSSQFFLGKKSQVINKLNGYLKR